MEELLNVLNLFIKLQYFAVQHKPDTDSPRHYIFTLLPHSSIDFDVQIIHLLERKFPQDIFMEITPTSVEFRAINDNQERLVDAFCDILRETLNDECLFISLLEAHSEQLPFPRILAQYKQTITTPAEIPEYSPPITENAPCLDTPAVPATPINLDEVKEQELKEQTEEIITPPPSTQLSSFSYWAKSSSTSDQPSPASKEDKLIWGLQHDLCRIVQLMDMHTQPTKPKHLLDIWGGLKNVTQQAKNVLNPLVGDADAAINIKEKFRAYSKISGRSFNQTELEDIMRLVTSRLLHIQQDHLKETHKEEIVFLTSAEVRTRAIRNYLTNKSTILLEGYDELLTRASPGYYS